MNGDEDVVYKKQPAVSALMLGLPESVHLIFYDTFGNYCHLRLSSMKRAMSSSADRRGFVVV